MNDRRAGFAGSTAFPTSQGSKTSEAETPPSDTTRRHHARDPPGSGASRPHLRVLPVRRPFQVRLLREACLVDSRRVSCAQRKRGEVVAHRSLLGRRTQKVRGRSGNRTASLSRDEGCGVVVRKLRGKDVGGTLTRVGTPRSATLTKSQVRSRCLQVRLGCLRRVRVRSGSSTSSPTPTPTTTATSPDSSPAYWSWNQTRSAEQEGPQRLI